MNESSFLKTITPAMWLQGDGGASGGFFNFWVAAGLAVVAVVAFLAVYGYRRGWFEEVGFGPPITTPRPATTGTGGNSGSLEEAIKLLTYITKQLDVVDGRTKVLQFDLRKAQAKLESVESLVHGIGTHLPKTAGGSEFSQPPPREESRAEQTLERPASVQPPPPAGKADTLAAARGAYQMLADERVSTLSFETIFADLNSAAQGAVVGEVNYSFRPAESKHSQFVILPKDGSTGWLFPNPNRVFTEAMKVVFPHLSREQFEDRKISVDPMLVKVSPSGMWERAS